MDDRKRLNSETSHKIKQSEIDAWNRGKNDARNNQVLKDGAVPKIDKAVNIVKMFAQTGDANFISMKLQVSVSDVQKVLAHFGVKSIEDARQLVSRGVIAELDAAKNVDNIAAEADAKELTASREEKLRQHDNLHSKKELSQEEKDLKLKDAQDEALQKNKVTRIKNILAQGLDNARKPGDFQIRVADIAAFKSMIPHGVSQLQRRFGGSKKDVVAEIRRLSPETDVDMLRP